MTRHLALVVEACVYVCMCAETYCVCASMAWGMRVRVTRLEEPVAGRLITEETSTQA